jgi:hypothetical protein
MLCGENAEVRGKTPDPLLSIPKRLRSLAQGKLPTPLADLQSSRSFVSAFNAVATQSLGARELTDRQDDAERKRGVNEDFQDATAFFFGAD